MPGQLRIPALAVILSALIHSAPEAAQAPGEKADRSGDRIADSARVAADALDTLTGEVVDIQCDLRMRAAVPGSEAKSGWNVCGTDAVRRGAPVGLRERESDSLYVAVLQARRSAGRMLSPHVGRQVTAVGYRRSDGDLRLFEITKFLGPAPPDARGAVVKP